MSHVSSLSASQFFSGKKSYQLENICSGWKVSALYVLPNDWPTKKHSKAILCFPIACNSPCLPPPPQILQTEKNIFTLCKRSYLAWQQEMSGNFPGNDEGQKKLRFGSYV